MAVGPLGRGRQTQPHGRGRHPGGVAADFARQMMTFIEDHQGELVAELLRVDAGTVVGSDRDGPNAEHVVADDAGVVAQPGQNAAVPLVHQVAYRRDHQRAGGSLGHDRKGHLGLAGPGGHDDAAAAGIGRHPSCNGGLLLGPQEGDLDLRPSHGLPGRHLIVHLNACRPQSSDHRVISDRIPAPCPDAAIPNPGRRRWLWRGRLACTDCCRRDACTTRRDACTIGRSLQHESAAGKPETWQTARHVGGVTVAPRSSGVGPSNRRQAAAGKTPWPSRRPLATNRPRWTMG